MPAPTNAATIKIITNILELLGLAVSSSIFSKVKVVAVIEIWVGAVLGNVAVGKTVSVVAKGVGDDMAVTGAG
jgi:hypothetical protein